VPESRPRKKAEYTPPSGSKSARRVGGGRWVAPAMVTCWILGLIWIVVFYLAGEDIPFMRDLDSWNLLIGMGLVVLGFIFSTRWE